ncbi:MAG: phosphatidate cytidylyltransferase [Dialister invisus]
MPGHGGMMDRFDSCSLWRWQYFYS